MYFFDGVFCCCGDVYVMIIIFQDVCDEFVNIGFVINNQNVSIYWYILKFDVLCLLFWLDCKVE